MKALLLSPSKQAVLVSRLSNWLLARGHGYQATFVSLIGRWLTGIEIEPGAQLGRNFRIWHGMGVVVGRGVVTGEDCRLLQGVTLGSSDFDDRRDSSRDGYPTLGDRVTVYSGATIVGPVTVGNDSVVAANAVVTSDVPERVVVGGAPARILKQL